MQSLMTEEKFKLKRVTGGEYHRSSLVFNFERMISTTKFKLIGFIQKLKLKVSLAT